MGKWLKESWRIPEKTKPHVPSSVASGSSRGKCKIDPEDAEEPRRGLKGSQPGGGRGPGEGGQSLRSQEKRACPGTGRDRRAGAADRSSEMRTEM